MKHKNILIIFSVFFLTSCNETTNTMPISSFSSSSEIVYSSESSNVLTSNDIIEMPNLNVEQNIEAVKIFVKNNNGIEIEDTDLYFEKYGFPAYSRGIISQEWTTVNDLNVDILLNAYEYFYFNPIYIEKYQTEHPDEDIYSLDYIVVPENEVESFFIEYLNISLEQLKKSNRYDKNKNGFKMTPEDGLGGVIDLEAKTIWNYQDNTNILLFTDSLNEEKIYLIFEENEKTILFKGCVIDK